MLFFLEDGSGKILFSCSTGAESRTVEEEKKAVYQIRRPLGLAFVISFGGWENCCCPIFRWTLICPSLSQSPDLLVFPATYTPATQVRAVSGLRSYHRARLDIAAVSTALNRIDQILPL